MFRSCASGFRAYGLGVWGSRLRGCRAWGCLGVLTIIIIVAMVVIAITVVAVLIVLLVIRIVVLVVIVVIIVQAVSNLGSGFHACDLGRSASGSGLWVSVQGLGFRSFVASAIGIEVCELSQFGAEGLWFGVG